MGLFLEQECFAECTFYFKNQDKTHKSLVKFEPFYFVETFKRDLNKSDLFWVSEEGRRMSGKRKIDLGLGILLIKIYSFSLIGGRGREVWMEKTNILLRTPLLSLILLR